MKYVVLLLSSCLSAVASAQQVVDMRAVDVIAYSNSSNGCRFYKRVGEKEFQEIQVRRALIDRRNSILSRTVVESDVISKEDLESRFSAIYHKEEIRPTKIENLIGKTFELPTNEKDKKAIFKFLSKHCIAFQGLFQRKTSTNLEDDKQWHISYQFQYSPVIYDLGNERKIYSLAPYHAMYIPLNENNIFINVNFKSVLIEGKEICNYTLSYQENFNNINIGIRATLRAMEGGKYELVDTTNENVLEKTYDTIIASNCYVLGIDKAKPLDVYSGAYQKLNFGKVKLPICIMAVQ